MFLLSSGETECNPDPAQLAQVDVVSDTEREWQNDEENSEDLQLAI